MLISVRPFDLLCLQFALQKGGGSSQSVFSALGGWGSTYHHYNCHLPIRCCTWRPGRYHPMHSNVLLHPSAKALCHIPSRFSSLYCQIAGLPLISPFLWEHFLPSSVMNIPMCWCNHLDPLCTAFQVHQAIHRFSLICFDSRSDNIAFLHSNTRGWSKHITLSLPQCAPNRTCRRLWVHRNSQQCNSQLVKNTCNGIVQVFTIILIQWDLSWMANGISRLHILHRMQKAKTCAALCLHGPW